MRKEAGDAVASQWSEADQEPTHLNRRPPLRPEGLLARSQPAHGDRERPMASSLARLGAALPRARPRAAGRALPPGRWATAALGASHRAAPNGKSMLPTPISLLLLVVRAEGTSDWVDRRAVLTHESSCDRAGCFDRT